MSVIQVTGPETLCGEIAVQGSKNAALPLMAAALLYRGKSVIENVPKIQDVYCMMGILHSLGCRTEWEGKKKLIIDASELSGFEICQEEMKKMRSSIVLLGPLLVRTGQAVAYYPGGCSIGKRPVDLHFLALKTFGAEIVEENGRIEAKAGRLRGGTIVFPYPSVGATEHAVLTAVCAEGITCLKGCAREPEIVELCRFLRSMGAQIYGEGSSVITIHGTKHLRGGDWKVRGDRIVAGTYLAAALGTRGDVLVTGADPFDLQSTLGVFEKMGAKIRCKESEIRLTMTRRAALGIYIRTEPFPAFPTDMQPILMAACSTADGECEIEETVFEGRFHTADQLKKMGADVVVEQSSIFIRGKEMLHGAQVKAPDLRGGAALVIAALMAEGESRISGYEYIARGYESICRDIQQLGGMISLQQVCSENP